ncbi:MAG TPA: PKD domain-containing protein [Kiritimatiellia bacterium]|nr:PKD domain-containing protein [Kiritimatiellia bacterium]HRZ11855.1 PKD domain-containing protein [Kiritimatiellia bacterium]HSA17339.1 PKD domain-containing protein [Kiritimatiellia bacterium]
MAATIHYVATNSPSSAAPFTNWSTAAHVLQEAVDAAAAGDEIIVSNGIYDSGGKVIHGAMTNRVAVDKALTVRSVNGPEATVIKGSGPNGNAAVRCVYLASGSSLAGFTLTNGSTRTAGNNVTEQSGGGVFSTGGVMSNCLVTGNSAIAGGGSSCSRLYNCVLAGNSANSGGGNYEGVLQNCTLTGNLGIKRAGGSSAGTLYNCIVYYNSAPVSPNYESPTMVTCCTTPAPGGTGNITNEPGLVTAWRITTDSPCVGAGSTAFARGTDMDAETWKSPPSIGADEPFGSGMTGSLATAISAIYTQVAVRFVAGFTGQTAGRVAGIEWNFSDGVSFSNSLHVTHAWNATGRYPVILRAWNLDYPDGIAATIHVAVLDHAFYVATNGNDENSGLSWTEPKATIQGAVDAANYPGAMIWVSNGIYSTGGKVIHEPMTNRVAVDKPVGVLSVNGPEVTVIQGSGPLGDAAVRCVFLTTNAMLAGFTLNNGNTRTNGDGLRQQSGGGVFSEGNGIISNCLLMSNSANYGGGCSCTISINCILTGNSALYGGGSYRGTLCNSALYFNSAGEWGGGSREGTLANCTLTANAANGGGGGISDGVLSNCIVYYNHAPVYSNAALSSMNYCCTIPNPGEQGNITTEPGLVSAWRLSTNSVCMGAGHGEVATGTDLDGQSWRNPPCMGADEPYAMGLTGNISVAISATYTQIAVGYTGGFTAHIEGLVEGNDWGFGDGIIATNRFQVSHSWSITGSYPVVLRAWNSTYPDGIRTTVQVAVLDHAYYVAPSGDDGNNGYSWTAAKATIQGAVDAVDFPGAVIWVSNGVYTTGGKVMHGGLTNRVAIDKPIAVRSVNGPEVTVIRGVGPVGNAAVRCVYLTNGAELVGFTLTNGHTHTDGESLDRNGGGLWCQEPSYVSNCVLSGNSASCDGGGANGGRFNNCQFIGNMAAQDGGGVRGGVLNNCFITNNSSARDGGGAADCMLTNCVLKGNSTGDMGGAAAGGGLYNCILIGNASVGTHDTRGGGAFSALLVGCTVVGNSAFWGGGTYSCGLNNSIIYYNIATQQSDVAQSGYEFCCTPLETEWGSDNVTNEPVFIDRANGDYRLQSNSPCINRGQNQGWMTDATDMDGQPRIQRLRVDIGAYESSYWGMHSDQDNDDFSDYDEVVYLGTDPTNALSCLRMEELILGEPSTAGIVIRWQSIAGKWYDVDRATNLLEYPSFSTLFVDVPGQSGSTVVTDQTATASGPCIYRVNVK